jgi:putative oxidoreductase
MPMEADAGAKSGPWAGRAFWALMVLLALVFLLAASMKLFGLPKMVAEFGQIGLGQGFRHLTGTIEISGAVLLLWPRSSFFGALILLGICAGAFLAQYGPLHGDIIHVFVLGGLLAVAAWIARPSRLRAGG